jgi:ribosomal protein S18 acetylase RimI-like enzyme
MEEHRRKGIGTALTLHALRDSLREGNTLHLLYVDKGDYAENLYKKIGFKVHHTATWFIKEL